MFCTKYFYLFFWITINIFVQFKYLNEDTKDKIMHSHSAKYLNRSVHGNNRMRTADILLWEKKCD